MRLALLSGIALVTAVVLVSCGSDDDKKSDRRDYSEGGEGGGSSGDAGSVGAGAVPSDAGMAGERSAGGDGGAGGVPVVTAGAAGAGDGGAGGETTLPFHGLYIGEGGDDVGDGTRDAPFATLAHAASIAKPGDTIVFLDGVFSLPSAVEIPAGVALEAENAGAATLSGVQTALSLTGDTLIRDLQFQGFTQVVTFKDGAAASGTITIENTGFTNCAFACVELEGAAQVVVTSTADGVLGNGGGAFATLADSSSLVITGGVLKNYQAAGILRATDDSHVTLEDVQVLDGTGRVLALAKRAVGLVDGAVISTLATDLFQQADASELTVKNSDLSIKPNATAYQCFYIPTTSKLAIEGSQLHGCGTGIKGAVPVLLSVVDTELYDMTFGGMDLDPGGGSPMGTVTITNCDFHDVTYTALRVGSAGSLVNLKVRGTSIDVATLANWAAFIVNGTNASTIDLGTLAEPGNNTFVQRTVPNTTALQLNLQGQTVFAVGNKWTPNQQGADAQGHYTVKAGKVLEDSTAASGINYVKQYMTTTIRLAQIP